MSPSSSERVIVFIFIFAFLALFSVTESLPYFGNTKRYSANNNEILEVNSPLARNCFFSPMNCILFKKGELRRIVGRRA